MNRSSPQHFKTSTKKSAINVPGNSVQVPLVKLTYIGVGKTLYKRIPKKFQRNKHVSGVCLQNDVICARIMPIVCRYYGVTSTCMILLSVGMAFQKQCLSD